MTLTEEKVDGGIIRVTLQGSLDIVGTEKIEKKLTPLTTLDQAFVIMDLSGVEFMSSIGIGAIVRVAKALRNRGGNMVIFSPQQIVHLILAKTRIDSLILITSDFAEACRMVKEAPPNLERT